MNLRLFLFIDSLYHKANPRINYFIFDSYKLILKLLYKIIYRYILETRHQPNVSKNNKYQILYQDYFFDYVNKVKSIRL